MAGRMRFSDSPLKPEPSPYSPWVILKHAPQTLLQRQVTEIATLIMVGVRPVSAEMTHAETFDGLESRIIKKSLAFYFEATNMRAAYEAGDVGVKDLHTLLALRSFERNPKTVSILAISLGVAKAGLEQKIFTMMEQIRTHLGQTKPWEVAAADVLAMNKALFHTLEKSYPFPFQKTWHGSLSALSLSGVIAASIAAALDIPFAGPAAAIFAPLFVLVIVCEGKSKHPSKVGKRIYEKLIELQKYQNEFERSYKSNEAKWGVEYRKFIDQKAQKAVKESNELLKKIITVLGKADETAFSKEFEKLLNQEFDSVGLQFRQMVGMIEGIILSQGFTPEND